MNNWTPKPGDAVIFIADSYTHFFTKNRVYFIIDRDYWRTGGTNSAGGVVLRDDYKSAHPWNIHSFREQFIPASEAAKILFAEGKI